MTGTANDVSSNAKHVRTAYAIGERNDRIIFVGGGWYS